MARILFCNQKMRDLFFDEVQKFGKFQTWKALSLKTGIPKSMLERYRTGEILLPSERFEWMLSLLPKNRRECYLDGIKQKEDLWGKRKGGSITYSKHPELFSKGREKGIAAIKAKLPKYDFDIDMPLNEKLCEFVGAFIGDGFTNRYGSSYIIQFTGHTELDREYYDNAIIPISYDLFGIQSHIWSKGDTMRVSIYSKRLFEMLVKRFALDYGKKAHTTKIPTEITKAPEALLFATIRGIFDTDGCVFFDRRSSYKRPYPRITLQTASEPLYNQLKQILEKHFKLYTSKRKNKKHYIEIYGHKQLEKWNKLIGFSNIRHAASVAQLR